MKDFIREWIDKNRERKAEEEALRHGQEQMKKARETLEQRIQDDYLKELMR